MKFCQFDQHGFGLIDGSDVIDLSDDLEYLPHMGYPFPSHDMLIAALPELSSRARGGMSRRRFPIASINLRSPVRNPGKLIAAPVNYQAHYAETAADPLTFSREHVKKIQEAGLFLKATSSLSGPSDTVKIRFPERRTDHEIELVAVVGKTGSNISEADALSHVAGYSVGLDITLRGAEERSFRKSIDTYSVLGPWLVTADEIPDPAGLDLELRVNGNLRQRANTRDLILNVPQLIAFASRFYTLFPGDLVYTGTPEGVGPLAPGDRIHAHIERIGALDIVVKAA